MRVPTQDTPTVSPNGAATPYQNMNASPAAFGAQAGQAMERMGNEIDRAGDMLAQHAIRFQTEQNETEVNDAYVSRLSPAFRELSQKHLELQGKDAVEQMPALMKQMEETRSQVSASLKNPQQKRMFDMLSKRRQESEFEAMGRYATQQNRVYRDQTSEAMVLTQRQMQADRWNDDQAFELGERSIIAEIEANGAEKGQSQEVINARIAEERSKSWAARVERVALENPIAAQDMLDKARDKIDGLTEADLQKRLKPLVNAQSSLKIVRNTMSGRAPADFNKLNEAVGGQPLPDLIQAVMQQESGGREFDANGNVLTSSKGAQGSMQVMPTTQRSPGFGVAPAKDDSPQERKRVGEDYLAAMLKRYGGNQTLALAAYNAGPGKVDEWIGKYGDPNAGVISDAQFIEKIPFKETKEYVTAINAKVAQPQGTPPTSSDVNKNYAAWKEDVQRAAEYARPGDEVFREQVLSDLNTEVGRIETAQRIAERGHRDTLMTAAMGAQAGGEKPQSLDQLLAVSPAIKEAWVNADPDTQKGIFALLESNARGLTAATQEGLGMYQELIGMKTTDPAAFMEINLTEEKYTKNIPQSYLKSLMDARFQMNKSAASDETRASAMNDALRFAKPLLAAADIREPSEKDKKAENSTWKTYNRFVGQLDGAVAQFMSDNKRRPTYDETKTIVSGLMTQGIHEDGGWFNRDVSARVFEVDPNKFYIPIPAEERKSVIDTLTQKLGKVPSDREAQQWYTKWKLSQKAQ